MSEQEKLDALGIAQAISGRYFTFERLGDYFENESRFLKACGLFYRNAKDFNAVCFGLGNGIKYISSCREELERFLIAMTNPAIPKICRDELQRQRQELERETELRRLNTKPKGKKHRSTRLYLMRNTRNGFVKIGHSKNPSARESTLQSEDPEIELVGHWPANTRDEELLHEEFSEKRIRGEWFRLTEEDLTNLVARLSQRGAK